VRKNDDVKEAKAMTVFVLKETQSQAQAWWQFLFDEQERERKGYETWYLFPYYPAMLKTISLGALVYKGVGVQTREI